MGHKKKQHQKELSHKKIDSTKEVIGGALPENKGYDTKLEDRFKKRHDEGKHHHHY